jgi:PLP dependent protein
MRHIAERLQAVRQRIERAAVAAGRQSTEIRLLAVSKTFSATDVADAYAAGQVAFGENYVLDGIEKMVALQMPQLEWHLIGPVQSNKTTLAAANFTWIHTIDRLKIAQRLSASRRETETPLSVCVQVNISGESTKSGVDPAGAIEFARAVDALPGLRLRGLMGIAEPSEDMMVPRLQFHALHELFDELRQQGLAVDTLSMGMSADLEAAIAEGSTMVRVGTAIFGGRTRESQ